MVTGAGTELAQRLTAAGIPTRPVRWSAGVDPRVLPGLVRELARPGGLVHAHDAHAVTLGGLGAALTGRPLVATRRVDFHLRRRGFWGRACRVIAISQAVADVLVTDGIPPERITVVHSGIVPAELRATPKLGIRARLALPADALVAVNVAALTGHKDHPTLLGAAARLVESWPRLHWVVAGDGPDRPALEALRDELGLGGRVHFLGYLAEPARLIADADCFVMSSRQEGLGTSVLDAMALGIPVASTTAGGLPEMLQHGAGLLAPPGDPEGLAAAVARLLGDADLVRGVTARASQVVQQFTAARMAASVRSVYRSCGPFP